VNAGFQTVKLHRLIELDYSAEATATLTFSTDLPGNAMADRETKTIPLTTTRRVVAFHLAGTTKGKLLKILIAPAGVFRLFGVRVYARTLGRTAAGWQWYPIFVTETPDEWTDFKLPIDPTPDYFEVVPLPVDRTPDEWTVIKLPIEPTPDFFELVTLPIDKTPDEWDVIKLPIEPTPDGFEVVALPIDRTPDEWTPVRIPIDPTPDAFEVVTLPIDRTPDEWTPIQIPMEQTPNLLVWAELAMDE
jgi:hypothetical protein